MKSLFDLGRVVMTRGVADRCMEDACFAGLVQSALTMHANGNWGDICDEDWASNQQALHSGNDRIVSVYYLDDADKEAIWIITEWDRSATTILFPEEY